MWKKGTGEAELVCGGPVGMEATTASTDHGLLAMEVSMRPGNVNGQLVQS